jgi:putative hemolysin
MEILIIFFLTLLNGFFSLSEIALVSVKKSRIEHLVSQGNDKAKIVLNLLENPEHFLSSVQVGITLIGLVSGAYGGATLTDDFEKLLTVFHFNEIYAHTFSLVVVIGSITYFTIVLGELVPKTIAMTNAEGIALTCVPIITYFTYAVYPFVKLLSVSTNLILKTFGVKETDSEHMSEEELKFVLSNAGKSGVLESEESQVHQNIFYFNDQTAKSLMTHSSEVEWININDSIDSIFEQLKESTHSKFLVCDGSIDKSKGVITIKDFFERYKHTDFSLDTILDPPLYIIQNTPSFKILNEFKKKKQYIGIVIDEYGDVLGIITLHDLIEAIVGDLPNENDSITDSIKQKEEGIYVIDGKTPVFEINQFFQKEIIIESIENYTTLAGFILHQLKALPNIGDIVFYEDYKFIVEYVEGTKIEKVLFIRKSLIFASS